MINVNKLELGIKKARQLFKEYAENNCLELVEESKHEDYYCNEEYLDYRDMDYLEDFVQDNSSLSFDDMVDKLWENYIDHDSDIIGTEYFSFQFRKQVIPQGNIQTDLLRFNLIVSIISLVYNIK